MKIMQEECIPKKIREQIRRQIEDWEKKDKMFVSTRASEYVMKCLPGNSCLTLTAPSGAGKSFIARHTALVLMKIGYKIIPVRQPDDIRHFYQPCTQTVFIIDDICGNFTANQQQIEHWKQLLPVIDTIIADKRCKIIITCRLQVYKDVKFNILLPFKSCECNLISDQLYLTSTEKHGIAIKYIDNGLSDINTLSQNSDCFPLLCSLYYERIHGDVNNFFKNPYSVYVKELENLSWKGEEGKYKKCSLALLVIFNNQLRDEWFQGRITNEENNIIKETCEAYEMNIIGKINLKKELDTLFGTFVSKQDGIYRTIHDKLFDFLAYYFGQQIIKCLIDHADSDLIHRRFIWKTPPDYKNSKTDLIIPIPSDYLESYLQRFIKDWLAGKVTFVFSNNNMELSLFRQKLLEHLQKLNKSMQVTLINTKDTGEPKGSSNSGTTPLVWICYVGYTDMVKWILCNDVDVDQCRDDGVSGLMMASQEVHTDIVKLLLEKWSNVNVCDKNGCTPLLQASFNGHTEIVKLLLERNPDVNLCSKNGLSPLIQASQEGHTEIVKLLLEKNPDVNLCSNNGLTPLIQASYAGHTEIVKLLLEKNPDVNLCSKNGFSPLIQASCAGHTDIVRLLLEKNSDPCDNTSYFNNDTSISNSPSLVQPLMKHNPDINAQTYDGGNALYFSAKNGNIEITQLLLENNADSDISIHSKQYITEAINNHPSTTLDEVKQELFDSLVENTSPGVQEYVNNKSLEYAFDVVAGSSPLHIACFMGRINVVRCLIYHNDSINRRKKDGTTPLFYACEVGHDDIVRLLLDKGANTQMCRIDETLPFDIATVNGHTSIVMMLQNTSNRRHNVLFNCFFSGLL